MQEVQEKGATTISITAHLDLLGFSQHLINSSNDVRTKIGSIAIERINVLRKAIRFIEDEVKSYTKYYPSANLNIRHFNDCIILGMDVHHAMNPEIGEVDVRSDYTLRFDKMEEMILSDDEDDRRAGMALMHWHNQAIQVAKFIGAVARLHLYINQEEFKMTMPGCRTIITTGYRYVDEDFYSANFSFSNAHIASEMGHEKGFVGNNIYMENNVAVLASYNHHIRYRMFYAKYIHEFVRTDPYQAPKYQKGFKYDESPEFSVQLLRRKYSFRRINAQILAGFQLIDGLETFFRVDSNLLSKNCREDLLHISKNLFDPKFDDWNMLLMVSYHGCPIDKDLNSYCRDRYLNNQKEEIPSDVKVG